MLCTLANILPDAVGSWISQQHWGLLLVVGAIATFVLVKGADWLVEGASGIALHFGMPKVVIGATIVSLGTTSPEAAVSVMAAWNNNAGLALGNAVGSIIADTGFIFGLGCVLTALPADKFVLTRQGWVQFGSAMLLAGLCYFAFFTQTNLVAEGVDPLPTDRPLSDMVPTLDRWVGVLMLGLLAAYMWVSVRWAKKHPHGEPFIVPDAVAVAADAVGVTQETVAEEAKRGVPFLLGMIGLGLAVVVLSSEVVIGSVTEIAVQWNVPQVVLAATLVAMGTSLPELVVGMTSIRKGHPELLVGNVIGADILNVFFVIGAAAIAKPLPIVDPAANLPEIFLYVHLPTMLIVLVLFRIYIFRAAAAGRFSRWMGWPLLALYVAYTAAQFIIK